VTKKKKNAFQVVTRETVDAAAAAFRTATGTLDSATETLARSLASFFPSKGKGKTRVPAADAAAIGETAGVSPSRLRGILAFGDGLRAGFVGTEREFRSRNAGKGKGKGKGGRNAKSPAARIADILAKVDPSEIDAVLEEARDIAAALTVVDDDGDDDAGQ
jgi:hypothetical protein